MAEARACEIGEVCTPSTAIAISEIIRMTSRIMKPAMANEKTAAGPAWLIVVEEPTNSPAPMMPPMAIIET